MSKTIYKTVRTTTTTARKIAPKKPAPKPANDNPPVTPTPQPLVRITGPLYEITVFENCSIIAGTFPPEIGKTFISAWLAYQTDVVSQSETA
ncbi:hypothetical protein [Rhodoligotrophos defluvii]|uniref:hypothetical protein n=1 Tax=Rhodoligotrophos defluvii TaxID=2561934 RepID=UPI0010C980F7|nr:hypothetical protein [Rhodoligotrophos defluvii]